MGELETKVNSTTKVFMALLTLGLIGLLFLIVFGNLSGNLGFASTTTAFTNENNGYAINGTTYTLSGQSTAEFVSLSVSSVVNATGGQTITSGNFTVNPTAGTIVGSPGRTFNISEVNVTYSVISLGDGERDTNNVITNLTGGAVAFFSFSNVWFTLLAVVLLIIIVMSVIGVVNNSKKSNFAS